MADNIAFMGKLFRQMVTSLMNQNDGQDVLMQSLRHEFNSNLDAEWGLLQYLDAEWGLLQ
jgi:hypothetical protein